MLKIIIPTIELFDESKEEFIMIDETILQLEHSLVSLSKWESNWNKPFLTKEKKTIEETIDYIKCMTVLPESVNNVVYDYLSNSNIELITKYIESNMTATRFSNENKTYNREIITAEVIYYWMIALNIPMECQNWHLDRLLTLIKVCNIHNDSSHNKISSRELANRNAALNAARKKSLNSEG